MADKPQVKTCTKCGLTKPLSAFSHYTDPRRPHLGPRPTPACKSCRSQRAQEWAKKNPRRHLENMADYYARGREAIRKKRRMATYGLSEEDHDELFKSDRCFICGSKAEPYPGMNTDDPQLHIDHCHETGKVRGRLCHHCNHGLGNFADNPVLLENAIKYLKGKTWRHNVRLVPARNLRAKLRRKQGVVPSARVQ